LDSDEEKLLIFTKPSSQDDDLFLWVGYIVRGTTIKSGQGLR